MLAKYSKKINDSITNLQFDGSTANTFDCSTARSAESIGIEAIIACNILSKANKVITIGYTNDNPLPENAQNFVRNLVPYYLTQGTIQTSRNYTVITPCEFFALRNTRLAKTYLLQLYGYKSGLTIINENGTYYKYILSDSLAITASDKCSVLFNSSTSTLGVINITAGILVNSEISTNDTLFTINTSDKLLVNTSMALVGIDQSTGKPYSVYGYYDTKGYVYSGVTIPSGTHLSISGTLQKDLNQ